MRIPNYQSIRSVEEIAEDLKKAIEMKATTPDGLWAKEDAIHSLECELMDAYQAKRVRTGAKETDEFYRLARFSMVLQDC